MQPLKESFDYHTIEVVLLAGEGNGIQYRVKCLGADKDDCACTANECQMLTMVQYDGIDMIKSAGDVTLGHMSARMDYSDFEEPWIEVEP